MVLELNFKEMKDKAIEKWRTRNGELHLKIDMGLQIVWDKFQISEVRYNQGMGRSLSVRRVNMSIRSLKTLKKSLLDGRLDLNHFIPSFKKNKTN